MIRVNFLRYCGEATIVAIMEVYYISSTTDVAMASYIICFCLVRLALPLCLAASVLFRQNLFSFIYLLLFFFSPWIRVPTVKHWKGGTHIYLMVVFLCSLIISLAQLIFQIVLLSLPPYAHFLENCNWIEKLLRHIGFVRLDTISSIRGVQALGPDVLMLASSIVVYIICQRAATIKERPEDDEIPVDVTAQMKESRKKRNMFLIAVGKYVSLITLGVVGSLQPSVLNGIYFVAFLGSITWWACYKDLQKTFAIILHFIVLISSLHICAIFSMQLQYLQEIVADRCNICRYLGLKALVSVNCLEPNNFEYTDDDIPYFFNPVLLMWMYYVLALEARLLIKPPKIGKDGYLNMDGNTPLSRHISSRLSQRRLTRKSTARWQSATRKVRVTFSADDDSLSFRENSPLIGTISSKSKYQSTSNPEKPHVLQDAMGSVTITDGPDENIHLQQLNDIENTEDTKISPFEILLDCINSLFQVINKSAYIATNIIMMAWSIMYHSWLTFVLLLWASLLWMIPNQRRAMLRSSPFLVFYAELLLIAQYIYGMDLTDKELPQEIQGINLKQIGIEKPIGLVCKPLFIKILFTTMFWITLRQFMQERYEHRSTSTLQDLAAPLQVTVNTATSGFSQNEHQPNSLMTKLGDFFKYVLTRCLIWIVAIMLLVIGLTGTRMTLFRIVYTALFLIFVIIFQVSYKIWRKIMYGFWLTVIVFSMSILVLVYTYQFDNFKTYWENLGVPHTLQLDIGLERFETGELFVRLVPPTFFLIITVIQLHYFHKDFLEISDIKVRSADHLRRTSAALPFLPGTSIPAIPEQVHTSTILRKKVIHFGKKCKRFLSEIIDLSCLFLELHMLRIMLISIMFLCVYDVSTLHFGLLLLITIALPFGDRVQLVVTHICVIIVSCLILAKMIYQIEYIQHDVNNVNCVVNASTTYGVSNFIANDIDWLGFHKSSADHSLGDLLKGYIGIIVVATILAFVNTRQIYMRRSKGQSSLKPTLMFAGVTRSDADKNVAMCIKYIFNYGFYKFGVEVCLMTLVALIATRMDFYAVLYSIWLCIMFAMTREKILNVWGVFKVFMIIILPLQYALAVGLPPTLCIEYPWYSDKVLARFQHWMFFPDPLNQPDATRLICDFILLMMVCRQSMVFNIENQVPTIEYPGGSNKDISKEVQDPGFVNPVPDHITYVRSWLDIFKRVVMGGFMWFTLAVVFLAGTNRVNLFSVGYLCGSFIFLWQGEEMYLRPLKAIIRWWNFLLAFNVSVITLKALLQIAGCIFIEEVRQDATWALQLFGIACINVNRHLALEELAKSVSAEDVSLAWDGVCFGFIIMLRRLLNSYYFVHLVNEAKAMALLASRGAELIEELRLKQITDQQEQEYEILEKIKKKMERIKATQQKIKGETFKQPRSHAVAILSGDYYMFEEFDDELDLLEEEKDESPSEDSDDSSKRITLNELLAAAMKTDVQQAVGMAQKKKEPVDHTDMPRKKSSFFSIQSRTSRQDQATSQPMSDETLPSPAESFYSTERRELESSDKKQEVKDDEIIESIPTDEEEVSREDQTREPLHTSRGYAYFRFAIAFIESAFETVSKKLNTLSRDYRYVMKVLSFEKKTLKESSSFNERVRLHSNLTWEPVPLSVSERTALRLEDPTQKSSVPLKNRGISWAVALSILSGIQAISLEEMDQHELSASSQPAIVRLILSLWYAVISHSDLVCYFMVFILQMKSATILSLPLPLMVFLWGTLSVPRPTKTFWVTMIAYTEVIVIVKCMFQFDFVPWNQQAVAENAPFFPPRIIGIEGQKHYAIYDLLLLLIIFFHRFMLKSLGLWKSTYDTPNEYVKGEKIYELMEDEDTMNFKERRSVRLSYYNSPTRENRIQSLRHEHIVTAGGLKLFHSEQSGGGDDDDKINKATLIVLKTENAILLEHFPKVILMGVKRYLFAIQSFFQQLLSTSLRVTTDVYAYMFMCDFFNLIVLIIGFASFGTQQGDGGVSSYLKEDKVPIPFLIMTILQFGLIIIDRALFLRKYILGKVVFQFFLVFGIHIWMFFILPAVTDRPFNAALPPQMWYMVKCIYLLLSAYQIRSGYPTRILGNFLCKKYNIINMILFKGFMLIPFLFELRALMDWIWTDTSMTLFDWLKMEDIFGNIFQLKCSRRMEAEYPQPRGERKRPVIKYLMGGGLLFIVIGIIWFPLVFFALGSTVGEPNTPYEVDLNLRIGTYQPIFKMSAQNSTIYRLSDVQFTQFANVYKKDKVAQTFLSNYDHDDIGVAIMNRNSTTIWTISPPDQKRLIAEMKSDVPIIVKLTWTIRRITNDPKIPPEITASKEWILQGKINNERNPVRDDFVKVLTGNDTKNAVILNYLLPKFLKVTNQGQANAVSQLLEGKESEEGSYRNVSLKLYSGKYETDINSEEWWEMSEVCNDFNYKAFLQNIPLQSCDNLVVYTFNDKSFPSTLTFISGAGIIGLYTTLVLIASNIVRGFFTGVLATIMFDDLPNVDRILQLCLDIYLVRESGELALEEDLFAKLIFLYRSPETLIKWTRPREEGEGDGDGGDNEGNDGAMQPIEQ